MTSETQCSTSQCPTKRTKSITMVVNVSKISPYVFLHVSPCHWPLNIVNLSVIFRPLSVKFGFILKISPRHTHCLQALSSLQPFYIQSVYNQSLLIESKLSSLRIGMGTITFEWLCYCSEFRLHDTDLEFFCLTVISTLILYAWIIFFYKHSHSTLTWSISICCLLTTANAV